MAKFKFVATDAQGNEKTGTVETVNRAAVLAKLKEMGYFPSSVDGIDAPAKLAPGKPMAGGKPAARRPMAGAVGKGKGGSNDIRIPLPQIFGRRISKKQLTIFTRQLATLIDSGVQILRALQILQKQDSHYGMRRMIADVSSTVEGGGTFAEALSHHPKVFDRLYINMVKAGEVGGVLPVTLNRLAEFAEKAERIKARVKGAMVYPIVVLIMALGIMVFLMLIIIPKFTEIFNDLMAGKQLPALTRMVVAISNGFIDHYLYVGGALAAVIVGFNLFGRTSFGRYQLDKLKLNAPVFGNLTSKASISRFSRTFGTLLSSGVQILQALNIVKETAGNEVMARAVQRIHDSVKEGESVATPVEASRVFPNVVVSMINVGEETGRLPEMLTKIADNYDTEVDAAVDGLTSLIEPLLLVFLAVVVGTIVIAMFLPLISIISNLR